MKRTMTDEELEKILAQSINALCGLHDGSADAEMARYQAVGTLALAYNKLVSRMYFMEQKKVPRL